MDLRHNAHALSQWASCLEHLQQAHDKKVAQDIVTKLQACTASVCSLLSTELGEQSKVSDAVWTGVHRTAQIMRDERWSQVHQAVSASLNEVACAACQVAGSAQHGNPLKYFVVALMAVLRPSKVPLFMKSDALHLWTVLAAKASTMPDKDHLSLSGQILSVLLCASLDTILAAIPRPALPDAEAFAVARFLAHTSQNLTASRSFLSIGSSSRLDHLACALRAIASIASLSLKTPSNGLVPDLVLPQSSQPQTLLPELSAYLDKTVDAVLDPMEVKLPASIRKGIEAQERTMTACCTVLEAAGDAMAILCVTGGSGIRSRLRGLLTCVAKRASEELGLASRTDSMSDRPQGPAVAWGWDCRALRLTRSSDNGKSPRPSSATQLCQQLSIALAKCAVEKRPANTIALPFALVPSHKTGASFCEHVAAVLCLGHMAKLCETAPQPVAEAVASAIMPVFSLALSNLTSPTSSPAYSPAAYACILETMGRSVPPLVHSGASWVYQRASSILLRAYHSPDSDVYKIFMYRHSSIFARPPPAAGALARALEAIGEHAFLMPPPLRTDYSRRLLSVFTDFTMASKPGNPSKSPPLDSVALLPSLAAACEAAQLGHSVAVPDTLSQSHPSTPPSSAHAGTPASQPSASTPASSSLVLSKIDELRATDAPTVKLFRNVWLYCGLLHLRAHPAPAYLSGWPPAEYCLSALGRLAAATPVLMYGTGTAKRQEAEQRVLLELQPHLSAAGELGSPTAVVASLTELLTDAPAIPSQNASNAFLLAVAALEMSRADSGPISTLEEVPMPLMHALAYEAGALPSSLDQQIFASLVRSSFYALARRLTLPASTEKDRFAKLERLACTLINTTAWQTCKASADQPKSGVRLDVLREHLLMHAPFLFYSPRCLSAWLSHESNPRLLKGVQAWLKRAAARAPTHMEHLLQRFLVAAAEHSAVRLPLSKDLVSSTKLLDAISAGRADSQLESVTEVGLMALHEKGAARGRVQAIQELVPNTDREIVKRLAADAQRGGEWGADEKKLCLAAAALATSSMAADAVPHQLTAALCALPLGRFTGAAMHDVAFAWHWMAAECAATREVLLQGIAQAWDQAASNQLGLFSGALPLKRAPLTSGDLEGWDVNAGCEAVISALHAHHVWLICLLELWECSRHAVAMDAFGTDGVPPVMWVFHSIIRSSVSRAHAVCTHPLARAPLFRLLSLAMRVLRHVSKYTRDEAEVAALLSGDSIASLLREVTTLGLVSFAHAADVPVMTRDTGLGMAEVVHALAAFEIDSQQLQKEAPAACAATKPLLQTLHLLVSDELSLQRVLIQPLIPASPPELPAEVVITSAVDVAWQISPALASALAHRFHRIPAARQSLFKHTINNALAPQTLAWAQGAPEYAAACHKQGMEPVDLANWATMGLADALAMLTRPYRGSASVRSYVMRCLSQASDDDLVFWLPQVVQQLRGDKDGTLRRFLLETAIDPARWMLLHKLVWALETEERPGEAEFNPEVKRSGWQPPRDTGLWKPCQVLKEHVLKQLPDDAAEYFEAEHGTFQQVTDISGILKPVPKERRRDAIAQEARKISVPRDDLYLPVDVHKRLVAVIPESGRAMQSAAKTPVLLAFEVEVLPVGAHDVRPCGGNHLKQACIFKVGDDCRQDVLALQIITLLRNAFKRAGLPLYVNPYGVLPTGYERGIIEVVPDTKSRAGMGEMTDVGLYEIFQSRYGAPGTPSFEAARRAFILSEAGYAVASYILQSKDRHNGNILVDSTGRIVHIDFGFIFEISPGGNLGFETAAFKFSYEMVQLIDPGGQKRSAEYQEFKELCVKGFLAARCVAEDVMVVAALMAESGLPCYSRGKPLENLRARFLLDASPQAAAEFMRGAVDSAYKRWTTGFYDYIQILQNDIPF